MKNKIFYALFVLFFFLTAVLSRTKFEIRKEIIINAPIEQVWQAIIEFENYKNWNSQLAFLGGKIELNEKIHLRLSVEGAEPYEFMPTVSRIKDTETFSWIARTGIPGVFDGEHFFELREIDSGRVLLVNREEYRGILSLIIEQLPMMKLAPRGFEKMNTELKDYIEGAKVKS